MTLDIDEEKDFIQYFQVPDKEAYDFVFSETGKRVEMARNIMVRLDFWETLNLVGATKNVF